jgi:asparagine synthase (glutamine-hydrolysing)
MCGIAGIITFDIQEIKESLLRMSASIAHRGPDSDGIYITEHIGLAHRRLSILDLSTNANQPMYSADGRYVLVYNGEIYNFLELKKELIDYPFQTKSDTEIILAAFIKWGTDSFKKFNGMFAFGLWDTVEKTFYLVRDRNGIKPVYYVQNQNRLLFASEVRALLSSGLTPPELNKTGILEYFQYQTVQAPDTLIEGVKLLEAGHYLCVKLTPSFQVETKIYHSFYNSIGTDINKKDYATVKQDIYRLLLKSMEQKMIADVPTGVFLSGGIDSSIIVGLMAQLTDEPVNTFNVNFDERDYSEAYYARLIAKKFKANHTEIRLQPNDFLNSLPNALAAIDHPSGDGPNTWIVSREVRKHGIKVAFSGLGGDELFAGYAHFKRTLIYNKYAGFAKIPSFLKYPASYFLKKIKPSISTNKFTEVFNKKSWDLSHTYPIGRRMFLDDELSVLLNLDTAQDRVAEICASIPLHKELLLSQITLAELDTYMQHVLLRDTDQMAMAIPIEGRLPFLDNDLIDYVLNIPDTVKNPVTPKKLLVDSVGDLLPSEIVDRPKMGFVLPWDVWMKTDLYDFCNGHISGLCEREFVNADRLQQLWKQFLSGSKTISWSRMWYLIVLNYWLERYGID